jgi:hypothetical protein
MPAEIHSQSCESRLTGRLECRRDSATVPSARHRTPISATTYIVVMREGHCFRGTYEDVRFWYPECFSYRTFAGDWERNAIQGSVGVFSRHSRTNSGCRAAWASDQKTMPFDYGRRISASASDSWAAADCAAKVCQTRSTLSFLLRAEVAQVRGNCVGMGISAGDALE